jgi:hypothetical protein
LKDKETLIKAIKELKKIVVSGEENKKSLKECFHEFARIDDTMEENCENEQDNSNPENRDQNKSYDELFKEYLYKNKIYKLLEELFEKITAPPRKNKTKMIQESFTIIVKQTREKEKK